MKSIKKLVCLIIYAYLITLPLITVDLGMKKLMHLPDALIALAVLIIAMALIFIAEERVKFFNFLKDFFRHLNSIFLFGLFIIMAISFIYSADKSISINESIRFGSYIVLFFIIKYIIDDRRFEDNIIKIYVGICALISTFGIVQYFTRIGLNSSFIGNYGSNINLRITSTLDNPNALGAFLVLAIFPLIFMGLKQISLKSKIIYAVVAVLILSNIILSFSRNALLGLIIGTVILIAFYNWRFIFLFAIGGGISLFIPQVFNRIKALGDAGQDLSRIKIWKLALKMIGDHPIFGVGNGNFIYYYNKYLLTYPALQFNAQRDYPSHNSYLKVQSELGILGSAFFLALLANILITIYAFIKQSEDKLEKAFYTGFFASVLAFYIMNLSDNLLFVPKVAVYFWVFIAIADTKLSRLKKLV